MRDEVNRDLSDSAYDFQRIVWPAVAAVLGHGRIEPVETTVTRDFRHDLDVLAGIDAWQIVSDQGMRGIASRVQWVTPPLNPKWKTFTIRKARPNGTRTELDKRVQAFMEPDRGWLLPAVTVQAYIARPKREGRLLAVAVIRTADLYASVVKDGPSIPGKTNPQDGVTFDAYLWSDLERHGYRVRVIEPDLERAA